MEEWSKTWDEYILSYAIELKDADELVVPYSAVVRMVEHYFSNFEEISKILSELDDAEKRLNYAKNYLDNVRYNLKRLT